MKQSTVIDRIRIQGFRSLADVDVKLPRVALLIGANGSGKSNFIRFFELMRWMASKRLGEFVARQGGADDQLFEGSKRTSTINATVTAVFEQRRTEYEFSLSHAHPDSLVVTNELYRSASPNSGEPLEFPAELFNRTRTEAKVGEFEHSVKVSQRIAMGNDFASLLLNTHIFQFHDTSDSSRLKQRWDAEDCNTLRGDAANLAAILARIENVDSRLFDRIARQIRRILPVFDRFQIEETYGKVMLRWKLRGADKTVGPHLTSDGTLRFIALVTLLNLPREMLPQVLLIDEPELGLHPVAMEMIAHMIMQVSDECQVILATQSPLFVDYLGLDQTIVLDILSGRTEVHALKEKNYQRWLQRYSPSDLWRNNLLGGRP